MEKYEIGKLDKNLQVDSAIQKEGLTFLNALSPCFGLYGVFFDEKQGQYLRLPAEIAAQTSDGVRDLNNHTAGGRLRFTTDSPYVAIKVKQRWYGLMGHMTLTGSSGFDLYLDENNESVFYKSFVPPTNMTNGYEAIVDFPDDGKKCHSVTLNFPLYNDVQELYIGLNKDSSVWEGMPYRKEKPIVYYGSSITQGGCASRPGNCYQAIISRRFNIDHINLGFSGNAKGEQIMAEHIASLDMSLFVMDYDHNAPSVEHLQATHEPFFRIIRKAHPDLPVIFVTKPDFASFDSNGAENNCKRREVVYNTYRNARLNGDKNVYFIDGENLFAGACRDSCTVDGCHPNDLGFFRMASVIGDKIGRVLSFEDNARYTDKPYHPQNFQINYSRFKDYIEELKKRTDNDGNVLLYGSSFFTNWKTARENMLNASNGKYLVTNRGFGGATVDELLYYYHDLVSPTKPSVVLFRLGVNDICGKLSPEEAWRVSVRLMEWIRKDYPGVKLGIFSVFEYPTASYENRPLFALYDSYAKEYAAAHENVFFLDIRSFFYASTEDVGSYRNFRDIFRPDGLHLRPEIYPQFADFLTSLLDENKLL